MSDGEGEERARGRDGGDDGGGGEGGGAVRGRAADADADAARAAETTRAEDGGTMSRARAVADASSARAESREIVFRVPSSRTARGGGGGGSARGAAAAAAASGRDGGTGTRTPVTPSVSPVGDDGGVEGGVSARDVGAVSAAALTAALETDDATMTRAFDEDDEELGEEELRALAELEAMEEESPPLREREADDREQEEVARAIARAEHLRVELDDLVLASTELLLKTITSTNDYFLLFNPQLMKELAGMQREAREWLERTAPKAPSSAEGASK